MEQHQQYSLDGQQKQYSLDGQQKQYSPNEQQIPIQYNNTPQIGYDVIPQRNFSLISELSPTQHLRNIMKELEGELWDEKNEKYIKIDGVKPLLNQEGRNIFFHFATATINPIVTMSNYRKEVNLIHNLALMQIKKAIAHFHFHWKDYEITTKTKINIITDKLMILTISSFYKALGAGDRSASTRNITETISRLLRPEDNQTQPPNKRGGFFSRRNNV